MSFDSVPGNRQIKDILRTALRRKSVLPSLLFSGVEGAGQRETALELAKAFNCLNLEDDACDECSSCKAIEAGNHPDVIDVRTLPCKKLNELRGENDGDEDEEEEASLQDGVSLESVKTDIIYIDQIREAIKLANMHPMTGRKRVFFLDDAAEMERHAPSASLKILEEPPDFSQFILITAVPEKLDQTILSRCRMLTFGAVGAEDIAAALRDKRYEDEARAAVIASLVRGNYHRALTEDWTAYFEDRREAWDWYRAILSGTNGTEFVRKFTGGRKPASREEASAMLTFFRGFGRDLLVLGETGRPDGLFNPDLEAELRDLAAVVEPERAQRLIRAVDAAAAALEDNANVRLMISVLFARMTG
jgi:DNA polymerase-3 subunit delta'